MRQERLEDRAMLSYKICLLCGHLQNVQTGMCGKCEAGKIGLGRPREKWAYLNLKIIGRLTTTPP